MTRTQGNGVGRACQVILCLAGIGGGHLLAQGVDLVLRGFFQFIDFDAHRFLLVCSHIAEISHDSIDFSLFAQVLESELLNVFCILGRELRHFFKELVYLV